MSSRARDAETQQAALDGRRLGPVRGGLRAGVRGAVVDAVRGALLDAWAVLVPVSCAGCGRADRALCGGCRTLLGAVVEGPRIDGVRCVALGNYDGALRDILLHWKRHGSAALARPLAEGLALVIDVASASGTAQLVVAVPASRAGDRARGFDPVGVLVARARVPWVRLVRGRSAAMQKARGEAERRADRVGAFRPGRALRRLPKGTPVVIVDDIVTTGATVREAIRVCRAATLEPVGIAALALTPRRWPDPSASHLVTGRSPG